MDIDDIMAEIGLQLHPARGRKPAQGIAVGEPRPLTAADVALALQAPLPLPTAMPPPIAKIRSRHHQLAQLLAMGQTDWEISLSLGYSPSRISVLKADPTFRELLSFYEKQQADLKLDISSRLTGISMEALETLQQRLDDDPEEFSNRELMDLAELSLDRTGHGKSSTVQVLHGLDEETAEFLKSQHQTHRLGAVHNLSEGQVIDVTPVPETSESGRRPRDVEAPSADSVQDNGREAPSLPSALHTHTEAAERLLGLEGLGVSEKVGEALRDARAGFRPQVIRGDLSE